MIMTSAANIVVTVCCEGMALACMLRKVAHQQLLVSALLVYECEVVHKCCLFVSLALQAVQHCC